MTDEAWWESSPFVWVKEDLLAWAVDPPVISPIDTLLDDMLPSIRFEGDILETDLSPVGLTEWIPGVDPISELIEETILPPLPPAVTTLKRKYERGEDTMPAGSGHVNIMVDLSGSMFYSNIGTDSRGNPQTLVNAAQALTRIMVNACRMGNHSFAVFTFGTSGGDLCSGADRERYGCATRQIWGKTLYEATDYDGFIATMKQNPPTVGDWSNMQGNETGYAAERCYRYMEREVGSQIPDVTAATTFFLTDALWGDMGVPGLGQRMQYGGAPTDCAAGEIDIEGINAQAPNLYPDGPANDYGFWYWAKKYHDDFGPFILFKINSSPDSPDPTKCYQRAYRQYVSGGKKGYEGCVFCGTVKVNAQGGDLPVVANKMVQFINDLGGRTETPLCGGKGVTF